MQVSVTPPCPLTEAGAWVPESSRKEKGMARGSELLGEDGILLVVKFSVINVYVNV